MICDRYCATKLSEDLSTRDRNRITFSSVKDEEFEQYQSPTYSIKYVLKGTEHHILNNRNIPVSQGRFLVVNCNHPSDLVVHSKKEVLGLCIHLKKSLMQDVYRDLTCNQESLLRNPSSEKTIPLFDELLYDDNQNNLGELLKHIVIHFDPEEATIAAEENYLYYNLADKLLRLQNQNTSSSRDLSVMRSSTKIELLRRLKIAKEMIDENPSTTLDVNTIAQQAMLSPSHFFRSFKKVYRTSPHQYVVQKRIQQAATLIKKQSQSITDIALNSGFSDLPTFSKAFKKIYGVAPTKWGQ
jgi:AraC family transcriptional regulator